MCVTLDDGLFWGADLAQNRYFEDEAFIGYLKYLQYWQRPEYIKFIMYGFSV